MQRWNEAIYDHITRCKHRESNPQAEEGRHGDVLDGTPTHCANCIRGGAKRSTLPGLNMANDVHSGTVGVTG